MFRNRITDIFFDLDHTLWDFETNSRLTFERIFRSNDVELNLDAFLSHYSPLNLYYWKLYREERISKSELRYERLKRTFDALDYPAGDNLIKTLSEQYIDNLTTFNYLVPHTRDILNYLKPRYRLHIITNGFEEIQEYKLKMADIREYFDKIIHSEMAGVKKPNPRIFNLALELADTDAGRSLMIGDNIEADILGAKAVGFNTLHFNVHNDPAHTHCEMIHDLAEIKSYL